MNTFLEPSKKERIDRLFSKWDRPDSPGCGLSLLLDGCPLYQRGYGMANLEHNIAISPATVFRTGSLAKQFTAMAVLILVEQGKLSLDDDVREYVPDLPAYDTPPTIRNLLYHTSGIRDYLTLMSLAGLSDGISENEALALIAKSKELNFPPGSQFLYSNSGYFLLSLVVRQATGQTLRQFAHDAIFVPLKMTSSHFHDDQSMIVPRRASGYAPNADGGYQCCETRLSTVGDGGLFTTIADLAHWDENFYQGRLGENGHKLVEELMTSGTLAGGAKLSYACGLFVGRHEGTAMVHHSGAFAGFRAQLVRFPNARFSVVCLCNSIDLNPTRLAVAVADICLGDEHRKPSQLPRVDRASVTTQGRPGCYRDPVSHAVWFVSERDGELELDTGDGTFPMSARTQSLFVVDDPTVGFPIEIEFEKGCDRELLTMRVMTETSAPAVFERIEARPPQELKGYDGAYFSAELSTIVRVVIEEGELRLAGSSLTGTALKPISKELFQAGATTLEYQFDAADAVEGFLLFTRRVRGVAFRKLPADRVVYGSFREFFYRLFQRFWKHSKSTD